MMISYSGLLFRHPIYVQPRHAKECFPKTVDEYHELSTSFSCSVQ